jgi:hypothetical protein
MTGFKESGVGVCATPQIEIEAGAQADSVNDRMATMMKMRDIDGCIISVWINPK